jgi:hypothetical protein
MKFFLALVISCISCSVTQAEEYVCARKYGQSGEIFVVTHFFFNGDECYGVKQESTNTMMHVRVTDVQWGLYYGGKCLAAIYPQKNAHAVGYIKVPAGMEFSKVRTIPKFPDDPESLSGFKLARDEKILRIWNLSKTGLRILSQSELDSIEARYSKLQLSSFHTGFDVPTKKEAEETMLKVNNGVAPNASEVPLLNSTSSRPQIIEEANKPAQTDGDKPSN